MFPRVRRGSTAFARSDFDALMARRQAQANVEALAADAAHFPGPPQIRCCEPSERAKPVMLVKAMADGLPAPPAGRPQPHSRP
jgi:hypothetical protein